MKYRCISFILLTPFLLSAALAQVNSKDDIGDRVDKKNKRIQPSEIEIQLQNANPTGDWRCVRQLGARVVPPRPKYMPNHIKSKWNVKVQGGRDKYHRTRPFMPDDIIDTQCLNGEINAADALSNLELTKYVGGTYLDGTLHIDEQNERDWCVVDEHFDPFQPPCPVGFTENTRIKPVIFLRHPTVKRKWSEQEVNGSQYIIPITMSARLMLVKTTISKKIKTISRLIECIWIVMRRYSQMNTTGVKVLIT